MKLLQINFCLLFVLLFHESVAQELLSIDKAIEIALNNNYGIILSRYDAQVAKNENTLGNAGFLPQVNLNAGGTVSNLNTKQTYSNGEEVNKNGVASNNLNAGASINLTLFDGLKMFATAGKLKTLEQQGELNLKIQIENSLFALITSYYDVIRIRQLIKAALESLSIYDEREKITQMKFQIGSGSKVELLQTRVDKNTVASALLTNRQQLAEAKANLNLLLGRNAETDFEVTDSIPLNYRFTKDDLVKSVFEKNYQVQAAKINTKTAAYSIREYESQRMPKVGINASYNFLRSENKAGFSRYNQTLGLNAGFTASWNIFNGFNTNRQVKNAKLNLLYVKEQYEYLRNSIHVSLFNELKKFENARALLTLEEENILLAKENMDIALQRYKLGASGIIELKEAQNSFESAATRVTSARYNAKLSEILLMKLNGDLVK